MQFTTFMKHQKKRQIHFTSVIAKPEDTERESELQAINRILDRRYEAQVKLG